ncbi:hypothetical protein [Myxococcus phage Mx1]|nr:hypothetical protein [Myxococcus phage Mx1]
MADYSRSKVDARSPFPENAVAAHEWSLYEPLITPQQLVTRFLWGIPLVSSTMDPISRTYARMTDDILQDIILRGTATLTVEAGIDVFPVRRVEKKPFDKQEMMDLGYMRTNYRPVISVDKLSIAPGDSPDILIISPDWIASDGFARGEIRIIPTIGTIHGGYIPASTGVGNGSAFVAIMGGRFWQPSFFTLEYTTGFADGRIPRPLNELIGCYAAIDCLSMIGTTNRANSRSIGMDGMSESVSNAGPQIYDGRIKVLDEKRQTLLKRFRARYGNKFAISNI